jgi:DnaJ-class molecular chaperone
LELRNLSKETYKRMIDAFMVLKDPARRKAYDQTLLVVPGVKVGGVTDRQPDISDPHSIGPTTQQGRKFYDLALAALRERRLETAKFNLELALQAEPGNRAIQEKLNEISRYPR